MTQPPQPNTSLDPSKFNMTTEADKSRDPGEHAIDTEAGRQARPDSNTNLDRESTAAGVDVQSPDFQEVSDDRNPASDTPAHELKRFQDIKVVVSADLGRATVPLQTLMNLGEGSVLELNREIDSPVELVAQGVPLASGEVVVVNGCFAVRITQVYDNQQG